MKRIVRPEFLDELSVHDSLARASRRDLQRLNACMGHVQLMARELAAAGASACGRLVDLGAGDGEFLLSVAARLPASGPRKAVLVERQPLDSNDTRTAFARLGWEVEYVTMDVLDWLEQDNARPRDWLIANLFLHHFPFPALERLLHAAARRADLLLALEPRRSLLAAGFSRAVGLIGCNWVTRHDAPVSVRAGFNRRELSGLWPREKGWILEERPAGLFTHLFLAQKPELYGSAQARAGARLSSAAARSKSTGPKQFQAPSGLVPAAEHSCAPAPCGFAALHTTR